MMGPSVATRIDPEDADAAVADRRTPSCGLEIAVGHQFDETWLWRYARSNIRGAAAAWA
jgi:hypothetical protein